MQDIIEIIKPNLFKVILSSLIFVPVLALLITISYPSFWSYQFDFYFYEPFNLVYLLLFGIASLIISYLISSLIDHYISSKSVKLTIALISGLSTLIIIYIFFKILSEPLICDPIHKPAQSTGYTAQIVNDISVDKQKVEESLEQCLTRLQ